MKNIFKFSVLLALCSLIGVISCTREEISTDQFSDDSVVFGAFAPNPVVRGAELRIMGSNLDRVVEVQIPGSEPISDIEVVSTGRVSEIRVVVPAAGAEDVSVTGPVVIVDDSGKTYKSTTDITFTEGIAFDSFSPASAMPGDEITVKGDYLYNVQQIVLGGNVYVTGDQITAKSRRELKFIVPSDAVTGVITISDVDENNNPDGLIPNNVPSKEELVIGEPTVKEADRGVLKSGANVTVSGEYLNMIQSVNFGGVNAEFTVAEDGKSLVAVLPATAVEGDLVAVSYAGVAHNAGAYETLLPSELKVAAESRYKAGLNAFITGKDLDLVTSVKVSGVDASFAVTSEKITVTVPAESADGDVVVGLANGKTVTVGSVEVVKPVIDQASVPAEAVAGKDLTIKGTDLDLVTKVVIKDNLSEVECAIVSAAEGELVVTVNEIAATGVLVATSAAKYETVTNEIKINYDGVLNINIETLSASLGSEFRMTGTGFVNIANITIDDVQVTEYTTRNENEIAFKVPEDLGPGVYRLVISLVTGETVTWGVPFEVTASYTEAYIWQGSENLGSWSNQPYFGAEDAFTQLGIATGDMIRVYFTVNDPSAFWQFQVIDGHWGNLVLPELGNTHTVSQSNWDASMGYFTFEVTDAVLAQVTSVQGWGGAFLCQGENVTITGISLIQYGATETVIWEGEADPQNWATNLELGPADNAGWRDNGLKVGQTVKVYFNLVNPDSWAVQIFNGHWTGMSFPDPVGGQFNQSNWDSSLGYISFEVTDAFYALLTESAGWGTSLILQGTGVIFTKIAFI